MAADEVVPGLLLWRWICRWLDHDLLAVRIERLADAYGYVLGWREIYSCQRCRAVLHRVRWVDYGRPFV